MRLESQSRQTKSRQTISHQPLSGETAPTQSERNLIQTASAHTMSRSEYFQASSVGRSNLGEGVDPFLQIDHFRMRQPVFPPHPHAGFSAVTYMFEDSEGAFVNRDSLAPSDSVLIEPGDLHWTQAGSGVVHEEVPARPGTVCHGLQIFVNLSAQNKFSDPQAFHLSAADIPTYENEQGGQVRVVMGEAFGLVSPLETLTPVVLLDVMLPAGDELRHEISADHNVFVLVVKGDGTFGCDSLGTDDAGLFDNRGDATTIRAGAQGLQYVLCAGKPWNEPVYSQGPFVMNSAAQIQQVHARYMAGAIGALA